LDGKPGGGNVNEKRLSAACRLELRSGQSRQTQVVSRSVTHFGLGQAATIDVLRVLTSSGAVRSVIQPSPKRQIRVNLPVSQGANGTEDAKTADPDVFGELETEILREINRIRSQPGKYAEQFLVPLRKSRVRIPADPEAEFEALQLILNIQSPFDYLKIEEGEDQQQALAVIDEAIETLRKSEPLPPLKRNAVLDRAARFYSKDYLTDGKKRPAHQDSLGRLPAARIGSFGATRGVLQDWQRLVESSSESSESMLYVFLEEDTYFRVDYIDENNCRYVSVPETLGKFVVQHGREATLPILDRPGHECTVRVDPKNRQISCGDATMIYPLQMPVHGENVVWGTWSREWAARGLVCWWIIDPGIADRGHRHLLLDPDFKYCGIGVAWSEETGWVATLDCSAEPLVPHAADEDSATSETSHRTNSDSSE
jgi:uncharacterized protein YkwD